MVTKWCNIQDPRALWTVSEQSWNQVYECYISGIANNKTPYKHCDELWIVLDRNEIYGDGTTYNL